MKSHKRGLEVVLVMEKEAKGAALLKLVEKETTLQEVRKGNSTLEEFSRLRGCRLLVNDVEREFIMRFWKYKNGLVSFSTFYTPIEYYNWDHLHLSINLQSSGASLCLPFGVYME